LLLTKLAVRRPISVSMVFISLCLIAVYAIIHLPLSLLPNLNYPKLTIVSSWQDATPEEVEAKITSPIEEIGGTVTGVKKIVSTSYRIQSVVSLEFARNTDMDFVRFELNEKLQLLKGKLPEDVVPQIREYIPREFRESEFLQYGISGPYNTSMLNDYIEQTLKYQLSSLEGVSAVVTEGVEEKQITVSLTCPELIKISPGEIKEKINQFGNRHTFTNLQEKGSNFIVLMSEDFTNLEDLKNIILKDNNGKEIKLGEIAEIKETHPDPNKLMRYNGQPQITLSIESKDDVNSLELARRVKKIVSERKKMLPADLKVIKLEDESEKISADLQILYKRGLFSIIIIFLVLMIFLRKPSSTFLVISTIFLSTALTFICMYYLKIGLNMLSLAGLALGFGMMVDNSIVVYENIFRYQSKGFNRKEAAFKGVKEVSLPITASTLTTIIVFAPFLYMHGDLKIFYLPFVYAMVLSLGSSLFVSFTYIPLVASNFIRINFQSNNLDPQKLFNPKLIFFQKLIRFLIRFRWIWLFLVLILLGFTIYVYVDKVDKGIVWNFPKDDYISVQISLPVGSNINQTDKIATMFENKILENENIASVKTQVWVRYAYIRIDYEDKVKRTSHPLILREKLKAYATNFGNCNVWISGFGPSFGGGGFSTANFSVELKGYNYMQLKEVANDVADYMKLLSKRVQDIDINATGWWKQEKLYEYKLSFDRVKMTAYQISILNAVSQIFDRLDSPYGKIYKKMADDEIGVLVKEKGYESFTGSDLLNLLLTNEFSSKVKLSEFASLDKIEIMPEINREDELYVRRINFDYRGSYRKGKKFLKYIRENFPMPDGYYFVEDEEDFGSKTERTQLLYLLIFAVILVYMSLSSLFESFKYPFVILLTLPLAFIGVTYMFHFNDETFGSSARIGLVLLAGIVVNNSIIMVDHINMLRKNGVGLLESILQAVRDRSRPILMTSLTTIMALIPMVFRTELGRNDFWRLLALSTIGGLSVSTFFVLTFIPVLYFIFSRKS